MKIQAKIRFAEHEDIASIIELCFLHSQFEKAEYPFEGKASKLALDLFSDYPRLYCIVAECEDEIIGYATYMKQYATWDAAEYIYMDCLYLKEFARGLGIGKKMITRIKEEGSNLGCSLMQWQTPNFNLKAIKFYRRIGATSKSKERFFLNI